MVNAMLEELEDFEASSRFTSPNSWSSKDAHAMSDDGQLLSDEERAALAEAVASGDMASDTGLNLRPRCVAMDLTAEDSSSG